MEWRVRRTAPGVSQTSRCGKCRPAYIFDIFAVRVCGFLYGTNVKLIFPAAGTAALPATILSPIVMMRPTRRRGITIEQLWLAAPFFVLAIKAFRVPLPLLDFWWHIKMGEIIAFMHAIPSVDLFSFAAHGREFIVQNWIAEVLLYYTHKTGGFPLLVFLNSVALLAALFLVAELCLKATGHKRLAAFTTLMAGLAFPCNARPQVFSFVLFALFYWVLETYRSGNRNRLWLLPAVMVLWVNLHGSFAFGLILLAVYFVSGMFFWFVDATRKDTLTQRQTLNLGITFAACAVATLANPQTHKIYDYIRVVLSDQASQQLVMEWQPPRIDTLLGLQMFFGLFGFALLGFIYSRRRPSFTDLGLFFGFSIVGLTALRNTVWFAIVIAPIACRYWGEVEIRDFLKPLGRFRFFEKLMGAAETPAAAAKEHFSLNLGIVVLSLLILAVQSPWLRSRLNGDNLLDPATPVEAASYIGRHQLRGNIFHPQIFGDYLIWRLYPKQRSFIDGRVHLFGETFVRGYQNIFYDSHWEEKLGAYDIHYLLLSKDKEQPDSIYMIQRALQSGNWTVLFQDGISILFQRKN